MCFGGGDGGGVEGEGSVWVVEGECDVVLQVVGEELEGGCGGSVDVGFEGECCWVGDDFGLEGVDELCDASECIDFSAAESLRMGGGGVVVGGGCAADECFHVIGGEGWVGLEVERDDSSGDGCCHGCAAHVLPVVVVAGGERVPVGIVGGGSGEDFVGVVSVDGGDDGVSWCGDEGVLHAVEVGAVAGEVGDVLLGEGAVGGVVGFVAVVVGEGEARRVGSDADGVLASDVVADGAVGVAWGEGVGALGVGAAAEVGGEL